VAQALLQDEEFPSLEDLAEDADDKCVSRIQ